MKENADGRAVGFALKDAGPDLRHIFFLALRNDLRLARPPPSQVRQKIIHRKRQTGWAAVNDEQIARPMADTGGGDAKQFAEGIAWHVWNYTV